MAKAPQKQHGFTETSQQRGDRLLAEYQRARNAHRAGRMVLELSDEPAPEPSRLRRALAPWFVGFADPFMDAAIVASLLVSAATIGALLALTWPDDAAPQASDTAVFQTVEAAPAPSPAYPLGDGATPEAR